MTDEQIYAKLCTYCLNAYVCHEECEFCDEYLEMLEREDDELV